MTHLTCEVTPAAQSETFTDLDLGEITIGPMVERPATLVQPVVIENDPDLGPLVIGPVPAMRANSQHRTGPPRPSSPASSEER